MLLSLVFKNFWDIFLSEKNQNPNLLNQCNVHERHLTDKLINHDAKSKQMKSKALKRKLRKRDMWKVVPNEELRRVIECLIKNEVDFKWLVEDNLMICITDENGVCKYSNKKLTDFLGLDENDIFANATPFSFKEIFKIDEKVFNKLHKTPFQVAIQESSVENLNAQERIIKTYCFFVEDDMDFKRNVFISIDITVQANADKVFDELLKQYQPFENPILIFDKKSRLLLYCNEKAEEKWGALAHSQHEIYLSDVFPKISESESSAFEWKDGETYLLNSFDGYFHKVNVKKLHTGDDYIVISCNQYLDNVLAPKLEEYFNEIYGFLGEGIQVVNSKNEVLYFNPAAFNIVSEVFPQVDETQMTNNLYKRADWDKIVENIKQGEAVKVIHELEFEGGKVNFELNYKSVSIQNTNFIITNINNLTKKVTKSYIVKEQDAKLKYLLSNFKDFLTIVDKEGKILFLSSGVNELMRLNEEELIAKPFVDIIHENDKVRFLQIFANPDVQPECNLFRICPDTSEKNFYVELKIEDRTADPLINGIVISCREVTEIKNNLNELNKQKELYKLLSQYSRDLICLHESNGDYIYLSKACEDMLGFKSSELENTSPYEMVHPEDVEKVKNEARKNKRKGIFENTFQYRLRKKDGAYIWVETYTKAIKDNFGRILKLQSSTRDITQQKLSEIALLKSDQQYKDLINYSQAIIATHDSEGRFISVNPYFEKKIGYNQEEVIGKKISYFLPDYHKSDFKNYLKNLKKKKSLIGIFKVLHRNGTPIYLRYHVFKVRGSDENPVYNTVAIDFTEQILIEKHLKTAKQKAEDTAKAKELFLANMSHEIRTPLNGILGLSSLLEKTNLDKQQREYLEVIQNSGDNLLVIINDILDLAKIESGKFNLEEIPFNLAQTIQKNLKPFYYKASAKGIELKLTNFCDEALCLKGDPHRLGQVIINLINNAIKFTNKGSIELVCKPLKTSAGKINLEFTVKDTGIGIPKTKLKSIFESFNQVKNHGFTGTGLGLSICKKLLELQNGSIKAESKLNEGSTFTFQIPFSLVKDNLVKSNAIKIEEIDYSHIIKNAKVLVAEDNTVNQYLIRSILESWNIDYELADNGLMAWEMYNEKKFDLLLLDIEMPGLTGLQLIKKIRKMSDKKKALVPAIALTANAFEGQKYSCLSAGMNNYLSKPFKEKDLIKLISETLTPASRKKSKKVSKEESLMKDYQTKRKVKDDKSLNQKSMVNYNLENISEITGGDSEMMNQILGLFIETVPQTFKELKEAVTKKEWSTAGARAHKLKGSIVTIGAEPTTDLILNMEIDFKNEQNLENAEKRVDEVSVQLTYLIDEFKKKITG
ncbi:MAG: PAS domain-containing sensor histidine kinase [Chitinophagaceae bacterium]|nr:MAG: PAS domain-containing sensor histidine kinase [Chitinophagaceae bacterium]